MRTMGSSEGTQSRSSSVCDAWMRVATSSCAVGVPIVRTIGFVWASCLWSFLVCASCLWAFSSPPLKLPHEKSHAVLIAPLRLPTGYVAVELPQRSEENSVKKGTESSVSTAIGDILL